MAPGNLSDFVLQAAILNGFAILEKMTRWFRYAETCPRRRASVGVTGPATASVSEWKRFQIDHGLHW